MFRVRTASSIGALTIALSAISAALGAEFTPITGWDHQLFPSYLVATATIRLPDEVADEEGEADEQVLGDRQGVLGIRIDSPGDALPITVTITGNAILEPSTYTGTLDTEGTTYAIFPNIKYKYDVLNRTKQAVPVSLTFRVEVGDEEAEEQTATVTLHSVNDCPYTIVHGDEAATDISFMFAAYVNEQHPFVDKLLREALDGGIVDSFTGYQSGDPAEVYRQVYALWHALSERDVRYSNITTTAAETDAVHSQHVRLIDESINNAQANCVDGSVLLASLLRKIDIEPLLVYVPGHCYLAFYLDAGGKQLVGLETTLIGSTPDDDASREIAGVADVVDATWRKQNSWATFCSAIAMGNDDLAANRDKFNDPVDPDYQLVPIAAARKLGILPIAFDSAEAFKSAAGNE